ncbi:MAG: histidine kinase N-terminal 7TM domain-containing protein [Parcubacteria group bacterium]
MEIILYLIILTSIIYIALSIIVIINRKNTKAYRRYIGFIISGTLWVVLGALETSSLHNNQAINLILSKLDFSLAALIAYFVSLFALHFPNSNKRVSHKVELAMVIPILMVIILTFSDNIFYYKNETLQYNFVGYYIYLAIISIYFLGLAFFIFLRKLKMSGGIQRIQMSYIMWSYLISIVCGLALSVLFSYHTQNAYLFGISTITTITFALASAYVMIRYRFLDIRLVIRKGAIQLITFVLLFGIYSYIILLFQNRLKNSLAISVETSLLLAVLVIVITIEPLRKLLYQLVDRLFLNRELAHRQAMERVALISRSTVQFNSLVEKVTTELQHVFGSDAQFALMDRQSSTLKSYPDGSISVSKNDVIVRYLESGRVLVTQELPYRIEEGESDLKELMKSLEQKGIALMMPVGSGDELIGAFVIFAGKNRDAFTSDRIDFIKSFSHQLLLPFANALAYKQAMERIMDPKSQASRD